MKSAIIIDQQLQNPSKRSIVYKQQHDKNIREKSKAKLSLQSSSNQIKESSSKKNKNKKSTHQQIQSYALVLQQALTSNDKAMLQDITDQYDSLIIQNTIKNLSINKINDFLKYCQHSLMYSHKKVNNIQKWLKSLLINHLSFVINNVQNKECLTRIRRLINKRCQNYQLLIKIRSEIPNLRVQNLSNKEQINKINKMKAKFQYNQEQIVCQQGNQDEQNNEQNAMIDQQQQLQEYLNQDDYFDQQF